MQQYIQRIKDLEAQLGKEGWEKLLADTMKAGETANALGSESGVEALLDKQGPATAFDAALISGSGGQQFRDLSEQYGGGQLLKELAGANRDAQGNWQRLMGDVDAASAARDAEIGAAQRPWLDDGGAVDVGPATDAPKPTGYGYQPGGFQSYEEFRDALMVGGGIHGVGEGISPADALLNKLGEAGLYQGQTVAGTFRNQFAGGDSMDGIAGSLDNQNRFKAFENVEKMYGKAAAQYLWNWMTEGIWNGMAGQNSGAMYKTFADLIELAIEQGALVRDKNGFLREAETPQVKAAREAKEAAFNKSKDIQNQRTSGQSVQGADGTAREMSPQQAWLRGQAEQQGWLDEWERQFLSGVDEPVNPNQGPQVSQDRKSVV
jgi:hypothetical protein